VTFTLKQVKSLDTVTAVNQCSLSIEQHKQRSPGVRITGIPNRSWAGVHTGPQRRLPSTTCTETPVKHSLHYLV